MSVVDPKTGIPPIFLTVEYLQHDTRREERLTLTLHPSASMDTILQVLRIETDPNYFMSLSPQELHAVAAKKEVSFILLLYMH